MQERVTFPFFANPIVFDVGILKDAVCNFADQFGLSGWGTICFRVRLHAPSPIGSSVAGIELTHWDSRGLQFQM